MTETQLKDKVMAFLKTVPRSSWRKIHQTPMSKAGTADIIGCYKGRYVAIELKRPGKYKNLYQGMSKPQIAFMNEIDDAFGYYLVADSLQDVQDFIAGFKYLDPKI
jgi:penicillin-binding protein-related factor A (putative recombinase)